MKPEVLPPNVLRHFYAGGARIAALRGVELDSTTCPRSGSARSHDVRLATTRGLSRLQDGTLVRDAVAADPEAWLGAEHVARFGPDPSLLVKLLDAGQRLPVHFHPGRAFARERARPRAREDRGVDHRRGRARGGGARRLLAGRCELDEVREWMRAQDSAAMLGAMHEIPVECRRRRSSSPPARRMRSAPGSCSSSSRSRPTSPCCSSGTGSSSARTTGIWTSAGTARSRPSTARPGTARASPGCAPRRTRLLPRGGRSVLPRRARSRAGARSTRGSRCSSASPESGTLTTDGGDAAVRPRRRSCSSRTRAAKASCGATCEALRCRPPDPAAGEGAW